MSNLDPRWDWLVGATRLLAVAPAEQLAHLASLGDEVPVDELALEFEDAYRPLVHELERMGIPGAVVHGLKSLDQMLSDMSGPEEAHLWTSESLQRSSQWRHVRAMAAALVVDMERVGEVN